MKPNRTRLTIGLLTIITMAVIIIGQFPIRKNEHLDWYVGEKLLYYGIPVRISFAPGNEYLAQKIWAYLKTVDETFNDFSSSSEVGIINNNDDKRSITPSPEFRHALERSWEIYRLTNGAFDITIGPVRNLWKQAEISGTLPTQDQIDSVLDDCGLNKITMNNNLISIESSKVRFDFGGIIKGIAVDRVVAMLRRAKVESALVQIGGETATFGTSANNRPHIIGIQHPLELEQMWTAIRDPGDGFAVSTSGNYRNPVVIGDNTYYHIVNPVTGWPVDRHILSVTVVFPELGNNWRTDSLSTAGAVLGAEKTMALVGDLGGEVLFLITDGTRIREIKSAGWDALVVANGYP